MGVSAKFGLNEQWPLCWHPACNFFDFLPGTCYWWYLLLPVLAQRVSRELVQGFTVNLRAWGQSELWLWDAADPFLFSPSPVQITTWGPERRVGQKLEATSRQSSLSFNLFFFFSRRYLLDMSSDNICFPIHVNSTLTSAVAWWHKSETETAQPLAAHSALLLPLCLHQFIICPSPAQNSQSCCYSLYFCLWLYFCRLWSSQITHTQRSGGRAANPPKAQGCCRCQQWQASRLQDGPCASAGCRGELYNQYASDESKKPPLAATKYCKPHVLTLQRRAMEVVKDLEHKSDEKWLRELGMLSLEKRRFRSDFITSYNSLKEGFRQVGVSLPGSKWEVKAKWLQLFQGRLRLDIRKNVFTERAVKPWNRILKVVKSPSLEVFQRCVGT